MNEKKICYIKGIISHTLLNAKIVFYNILYKLTSSSVFIAINGMLVVVFSSYLYSIEIKYEILGIAFLVTFFAYYFNKITDKVEDSINDPRLYSDKRVFHRFGLLFGFFFVSYLCMFTNFDTLVISSISIIVSVLYSFKFTSLFPRLKEIVGIKSILVALSWAFTGTLLPIGGQSLNGISVVLVFLYIFIQLLVNTIICDIRDIEGDIVSGVRTIPIVLGINKTRNLLFCVNSLLIPWLLFCQVNEFFINYLPVLWGGLFYGYLIIVAFSNKTQDRLSVEFFVDGEWIPIVLVMALLGRN